MNLGPFILIGMLVAAVVVLKLAYAMSRRRGRGRSNCDGESGGSIAWWGVDGADHGGGDGGGGGD